MTNTDLVQRTDDDGTAIVMLNAPESINALSEAMLEALSPEFDRIAEDVRATIRGTRAAKNVEPNL
jgi:enoyl-CoA hydratase/carnithine racemase